MQDTLGLIGTLSLCTFGSPYICGGSKYRGVRESQRLSSMYLVNHSVWCQQKSLQWWAKISCGLVDES